MRCAGATALNGFFSSHEMVLTLNSQTQDTRNVTFFYVHIPLCGRNLIVSILGQLVQVWEFHFLPGIESKLKGGRLILYLEGRNQDGNLTLSNHQILMLALAPLVTGLYSQ